MYSHECTCTYRANLWLYMFAYVFCSLSSQFNVDTLCMVGHLPDKSSNLDTHGMYVYLSYGDSKGFSDAMYVCMYALTFYFVEPEK